MAEAYGWVISGEKLMEKFKGGELQVSVDE